MEANPTHEKNGVPDSSETAVLLVDDDPRNLFALESLLDSGDLKIVKAQTSDEALLALMNGNYAAIVLDVEMPGVNGIELARLIKQRRRTQHIPIIFLTAHYREEQHAVLAYDVGAVDYLTKPIHPAVLRSKVNVFVELFRKTRALAELNLQLEAQNVALQRETEERLRRIAAESARAEAEAANAAKDRFLAMLSHELRTPLTPIVYAIALLEKEGGVPPNVQHALDTIQRNVRLEARLIDDLLDLARIRSGKFTLQRQILDVHEVLKDTMAICVDESGKANVQVVTEISAKNSEVDADPARLRQIFWNLLNNAMKFTSAEGTVVIRTFNGPDRLVVEIKDSGQGIAPGQIERIFDAFEQAEGKPSSGGLGLGLAICKTLVELHGGVIMAQSEGAGAGALFRVELPCARRAKGDKGGEKLTPIPLGALRLLLVDDHKDTVDTLALLLGSQGHDVRVAGSIREAIETAKGYEFDVLISDIGLPDGRGTDLLTSLRERAGKNIKAIAMSGFGMEEDREKSRLAGFAEHLTKPIEFAVLERALTRLAV